MADNFLFYKSWLDIIQKKYSNDVQKQKDFVFEIVKYGINGSMDLLNEEMFMLQCQAQINSAKSKHDKRVEAGRKGGRSGVGEAKARPGNKNASKTQPNVNGNVNANANDNTINNINIINDNTALPLPLTGQGTQLSMEELARISQEED